MARNKTKKASGKASGIADAMRRLKAWMTKNGAPLLVKNLAKGAKPVRLRNAARHFGFPIPAELQALWSLHDGQREEMNGFVRSLDFLGTKEALARKKNLAPFVTFLVEGRAEYPHEWKESGVANDEANPDLWIPIAARDSDFIAVSAVTGRVFTVGKDAPSLHLLAPSVSAWLTKYADDVEAGKYEVAEGFGDYYLTS